MLSVDRMNQRTMHKYMAEVPSFLTDLGNDESQNILHDRMRM